MRAPDRQWGLVTGTGVLLLAAIVGTAPAAHADEASAPIGLTVRVSDRVVSQKAFPLEVAAVDGSPLLAGEAVSVRWRAAGIRHPQVAYTVVDADGVARFRLRLWQSSRLHVSYADVRASVKVHVDPARRPIRPPNRAMNPPPRFRANPDPPAFGAGANPTVRRLSAKQRRTMRGVSWRPGCVPMAQLREVHVNYWGADGYRHRGVLIARADVARRIAAVFVDLYDVGYRLRSMHPVDAYGTTSRGPGGDDYASMAAGNTSMFNCRYTVGLEAAHVWSPHSTGRSLDLNPWENPYRGPHRVLPNTWWAAHRHGSPMVIRPGGQVVRILARHGWRWAGWGDLHHFDYRS